MTESDDTSRVVAAWFARGLEAIAGTLDEERKRGHARTDRLDPMYQGTERDVFEYALSEAADRLRLGALELSVISSWEGYVESPEDEDG